MPETTLSETALSETTGPVLARMQVIESRRPVPHSRFASYGAVAPWFGLPTGSRTTGSGTIKSRALRPWVRVFVPVVLSLLLAGNAVAVSPSAKPEAQRDNLPSEPTPHTGYGPFYPPDDSLPSDNDLTRLNGQHCRPQGQPLLIEGTVLDTEGQPVPGAELVIWQTDHQGKYDHPQERRVDQQGRPLPKDPCFQYWGRTRSDAEGRYRFVTIVPGQYDVRGQPRPNHVHFRITHPEHPTLATELHFAGDPAIDEDPVAEDLSPEQKARLAVVPKTGPLGLQIARFPIVLR